MEEKPAYTTLLLILLDESRLSPDHCLLPIEVRIGVELCKHLLVL
jgi:hypothetical protein